MPLAHLAACYAPCPLIGRPVDMLQMPDGSLLISDDWNGAVYRLSYSNTHTPSR
jgi:glucose/arabinose dehydrogenase